MNNRFAKPENFGHPIRTPLLREHYVYRAFDAEGHLLYVGCSYKPSTRLSDHKTQSRWYHLAASFALAGPYNYETAREIERQAIRTERPQFNYTPEHREWDKAQNKLIEAFMDHLVYVEGVHWLKASSIAVARGRAVIRYDRDARIDDLTLPAVRKRLAVALNEIREAS